MCPKKLQQNWQGKWLFPGFFSGLKYGEFRQSNVGQKSVGER